MTKVSASQFTRPVAPTETRTFTDPRGPGVPITLTVRVGVDAGLVLRASRLATEYTQLYVTGRPAEGDRPAEAPAPMLPVDGVLPTLDEWAVSNYATIEARQVVTDEADRYTFLDLAEMSVYAGDALIQIVNWVSEMASDPKGERLKN